MLLFTTVVGCPLQLRNSQQIRGHLLLHRPLQLRNRQQTRGYLPPKSCGNSTRSTPLLLDYLTASNA